MEEKLIDAKLEDSQDNLMIKIEGVKKQYRLGVIGGTTLSDELKRLWAKMRKKEDPTRKIGAKNYNQGEKFLALNDVSFEVKKGEAIGLIGHNGAGKSTLLKLLTRVTAPTDGKIYLNGRVASMLEVGTGFHGELTGRENIYMNGAILGMTKKEIDAKMEDIIDFSEVRQFIDTPVKRYSSGMFVKLAFSVAAHLDAEIMLMDEVLAVGDMAFQNKCINKMKEVAESGKTIIYVSHNMNTIRRLCNRCVVLNKGQVEFIGDVEEGINLYFSMHSQSSSEIDLSSLPRELKAQTNQVMMKYIKFDNETNVYQRNSSIKGKITLESKEDIENVILGYFINFQGEMVTCQRSAPIISLKKGVETEIPFEVDLKDIAPGRFTTKLTVSLQNEEGGVEYLDVLFTLYEFVIEQESGFNHNMRWDARYHGVVVGPELKVYLDK